MESIRKSQPSGATPLSFCLRMVLLISAMTAIAITGPFRRWVEEPLVTFNTWLAYSILRALGISATRTGQFIRSPDFAIEVVSGCTGLFVFFLLASAIFALPASWPSRIKGLLGGAGLILILNQIRLVCLFWLGALYPRLFEDFHLYIWQGIIIVAVGFYWYAWAGLCRASAVPPKA